MSFKGEIRCVGKRKMCAKYYFLNIYLVKFHPLIQVYMSRRERYKLFQLLCVTGMSNRVLWAAECGFWYLFLKIQGLET